MPGLKAEIANSRGDDALQDERLRQRVAEELRARLANTATDARDVDGYSLHIARYRAHAHACV
jgi:hypothetical protein